MTSDCAGPGASGPPPAIRAELLTIGAAVVASLFFVGWVLWRVSYGFDLTDEGYYIAWISNPRLYPASVTEFGFVYHPLYRLVGEDIVFLRRANVFITLVLGWTLCMVLFRSLCPRRASPDSWLSWGYAGVAFVLATSTMAILAPWLPTPNYNSLAFQALMVTGVGLLLAEENSSRASCVGWILIGLGGWLAFLAKPTTAAALGVIASCYLLVSGKLRFRLLMIALLAVSVAAVFSSWCIDGSLIVFVDRLIEGVNDVRRLQGRYSLAGIMRWDDFGLSRGEAIYLWTTTTIVFLAAWGSLSRRRWGRLFGSTLGLIFPVAVVLIVTGIVIPNFPDNPLQGLQIASAPYGAVLAAILGSRKYWPKVAPSHGFAVAICFLTFPHVLAFGTNKSYWFNATAAGLFWVLAGIAILASRFVESFSWRTLVPVAAGAQACTAALLFTSMEFPYRQTQPLRKSANVLEIASTGSKVWVSTEFAQYAATLKKIAHAGGFRTGDPMIDLSGHYPGALYFIGAKPIASPWLIGGYKGSEALAGASLRRAPQDELKRAWILTEPYGPRNLSPNILQQFGIVLTRDYVEVGNIKTPTGDFPDSYEQHLLRPAK